MNAIISVDPSLDYTEIQKVIESVWAETRLDGDMEAPPIGRAAFLLSSGGSRAWRVTVDSELAGYFLFIQQRLFCYEAHTLLLPNCRGARAFEAARHVIRKMFSAEPCEVIRSFAYSTQPHVKLFCRRLGLRHIGLVPHVGTLNGRPVDLLRYEITRAQWGGNLSAC